MLLLVPTGRERALLDSSIETLAHVEICGFGPIVAAARTASLLATGQFEKVVLCGIAGGHGAGIETGLACAFQQVACYGIGAGSGAEFVDSETMGWHQYTGEGKTIATRLELQVPDCLQALSRELLVSVCAASGNKADVARLVARFPEVSAEDMEGFAVAAAGHLAGVPVSVVRGISNIAGDRDHRNWNAVAAMKAINNALQWILDSDD